MVGFSFILDHLNHFNITINWEIGIRIEASSSFTGINEKYESRSYC